MKIVKVKLKQNPYDIVIGENILPKLGAHIKKLNIGRDAIVITNPIVKKLYGSTITKSLKKSGFSVKVMTVPDGEKSKSVKTCFELIEQVAKYDILKRPFIVAVGGGVIGDLAGYVAAAYKRGIPYVHVPTSFLAQIDSAIGGKVAIDLKVGKNLVGAFYQPKMVYSDIAVLKTLPKRQLKNGMAEAIKYGVIYDNKLFAYLEKNFAKILETDSKALTHVVIRSSQIKADVVLRDEKETKGVREILNFGHTIGHAIEAAGGFKVYQHGEAIALGMHVAADISVQKKMLTQSAADRLGALIESVGLPMQIKKVKLSDITRLMKHDKKFKTGKTRFVLARSIGRVSVIEGVKEVVIKKAVRRFM